MNQVIIDAIRNGLMWIGLGALLLIAAVCMSVGLRRVSKALYVRLSPVTVGVFAVAAIFATCEAQKRLLRDGGSRGATALPGVTVEEITQGWRLESVTTNDAVSYAMPTNGVEYMPWSLGGGYEAHFPLDLGDDFGFPFGTGVVRRLDVLSGGMVESLPRQRVDGAYYSLMSICAAREYASIVPGVGRFWWVDAVTAVAGRPPYRGAVVFVFAEEATPAFYAPAFGPVHPACALAVRIEPGGPFRAAFRAAACAPVSFDAADAFFSGRADALEAASFTLTRA